ncbi:efflux RND transporter permease subunit [Nitrosophilus labii]|uniref:efflux RND transporter permease subunit n=1 Tax=Nitrosophilus labii TaxID=2706014 RepID=UPI0016572317|nr:efflux RND transporter permease subunit [Nitrosophilus labii]
MRCRADFNTPISWMVKNPVVANLLMIFLLAGGIFMLNYVKQEVFPDYERDEVRIRVSYPQASPTEIEKAIILPIEEAISSVEGIKRFRAVAREGSATVDVEAFRGYDLQTLQNDIENAIFRIRTFPKEAEKPIITKRSYERRTISLILYGKSDRVSLYKYALKVKYHLLSNPKISKIDIYGLSPLQISIEIKNDILRKYGLSTKDISDIVRANSLELSSGVVKTPRGEVILKLSQRGEKPIDFENIPIITTKEGKIVKLKDIAKIEEVFEDEDYFAFYNGKPAIRMEVRNPQSFSPIEISKIVDEKLQTAKEFLPPNLNLEVLSSGADVFEDRVKLLLKNAALGLVLVLITLSLFLEPRLAFWVMMGIPISFLGSFLLFPILDISISMISLFAFIIALGIVVDDAIVVGENIYKYRERGCKPLNASVLGAKEMAVPVSFSILTNIVAFMPILFVPGVTGKIFEAIPLVVTAVFVISWLESIFILPSHLTYSVKKEKLSFQKRFSKAFRRWVRFSFGKFLNLVLRHRYATIVLFLSLFVLALSYALSGRMGMQLFPDTEADYVRAYIRLPAGSDVEKTKEAVLKLIKSAQELKKSIDRGDELVKGIYARVGRGGANSAEVRVYLADPDIRKEIMSTLEFGKKWRKRTGKIEGVETLQFFSSASVGAHGSPIAVELSHFDENVLKKTAQMVAQSLKNYPGVFNIDAGISSSKEEIRFVLKPLAYILGFDAQTIAREIRGRFYGYEAQRIIVGADEVKIMAKTPLKERKLLYYFDNMYLTTKDGNEVPLLNLIDIRWNYSPMEIIRKDGKRVVTVEADIRPRSKALEVLNDLQDSVLKEIKKEFPSINYSFEGRQTEMRENLSSLKFSFIISLAVIYLLLAIPFKSYIQPFIVMISIPFGIIGAILGHLLMGYSLSVISLFGIIALSGIVVNDSLIMIKFANEYREKFGFSALKTAKEAAIQRFRPVFLTTLTTFAGLMPMIFETSRQAKFLIPMAISLGFGILFATFITLILVPSLYIIIEDIRR